MKWLRTYSWAISLLTLAREACSTGKGPGGIWPIDSRYTLLGDSNSNGLFVVDVVVGGIAAPPLTFERHARANGVAETRSRGWVSMTGVASCPTCKYLFVSSTHGAKFYRVDLPRTMEDMAKSRDFRAFVNASIVDLKFEGFGSTRMVTLTKDGKRGFIADYDKGVWAFDAAASDPSTTLQLVLPKRDLKKRNPAGCKLNEDDRELLVTVRDGVFSVDVASIGSTGVSSSSPPPPPPLTPDKKQSIRFVDLLRLCGMSKSSHLREAAPLPHPFLSGSFVFVGKEAGSNPGGKFYIVERKKTTTTTTTEKQQKRRNLKEQHSHQHHASEHHVVHVSKHHASQHSEQHSTQHSASQHSQHRAQQHTPSQPPKAHEATTHPQKLLPDGHKYECKKLAGSGVYGWQDGDGSVARFTRPHSISIRPGSADVLATDIDNRIVRLVRTGHGAGGHVSTVSYADGAHLFRSLWDPPAAGSSNSSSSGGGEEYNRRSSMEAPDWKRVWRSDQSSAGEAKQMMTASEARRDCESRNLGLCSLSSLRRNQGVGGGGGGGGGGTALEAVWTSDRCRSCWLHWPGTCPTVAAGKDDKIRALEGSHWGKGMQMMAFTRGSGADRFQLQTECMNAAKSVPASPVCCSR